LKQDHATEITRFGVLLPAAISFTLLSACAANPFGSDQPDSDKQARIITVTSTPAGASVRANGTKLGETPLTVNIDESFPARWVAGEQYGVVYRVSGELTLEKSGCDEYSIPVSPTAPAGDIDVTLVCREEAATPNATDTAQPAIPEDVEQRLKKLDKLYHDGVISAEEYKQHRARILGEL